ncbi:agamous-like MADS-box protein AGL80 [Impatiens glandulifera]|uniref:agamous-like MADS-box protein AGL80 n=1 Tax=Impatiens glandulifera TaxID=253017 RepID=UPI001FB1560D|nr:agamous-like MADS-box protein AGL80 [Impatiens glandulifera]
MTGNNVNLTSISNDTERENIFKKRKDGILKKVEELTTLYGIAACTIIYNIFDSQSIIWPSVDETRNLVMEFQCSSEVDQVKKEVNQEAFMRQRIQKMEEKLRKEQEENRLMEMTHIMFQTMINPREALSGLAMGDYEELIGVINQNMENVERVMKIRRRE